MDLSFGGFNNIIDASNITFKDARIPANQLLLQFLIIMI